MHLSCPTNPTYIENKLILFRLEDGAFSISIYFHYYTTSPIKKNLKRNKVMPTLPEVQKIAPRVPFNSFCVCPKEHKILMILNGFFFIVDY